MRRNIDTLSFINTHKNTISKNTKNGINKNPIFIIIIKSKNLITPKNAIESEHIAATIAIINPQQNPQQHDDNTNLQQSRLRDPDKKTKKQRLLYTFSNGLF